MAVGTILIQKLSAHNDIGYYEISTNDFNINNFYISIDKSKRTVSFFIAQDFNATPIHIVDFNKDEPIGSIPNVPMKVFTVILMRSLGILRTTTFPECLSYTA